MKRSEMIMRLSKYFYAKGLPENHNLSESTLKFLEDQGMAPPETGGSMGCSDPECCPQGGHYWDEE